jgi:hypothetical protein
MAPKTTIEEYTKKRKQMDGEPQDVVQRKLYMDEDCPICYEHMLSTETISWCQHSCGNNMHTDCFTRWASKGGNKCPWCRATLSDLSNKKKKFTELPEHYINLTTTTGTETTEIKETTETTPALNKNDP